MDNGAARDGGEDAKTATDEGSSRATTASKVPFLDMFRYADRVDAALMAVGTVAAVANGMSEPIRTVVFAAVIECFGAGDDSTVLHRVSKKYASRRQKLDASTARQQEDWLVSGAQSKLSRLTDPTTSPGCPF